MKNIGIGTMQQQLTGFKAFIPNPFPPKGGFDFDFPIIQKATEATRLLGKLDGITKLLPDLDFFILMYLKKDAASSSQIEGTRATMVDAIEAAGNINTNQPEDVDDILHYIQALDYGMYRVNVDNFPITLRFIRELHKQLMDKARASQFCDPGEFRKSQNWIGGGTINDARFVPPPVDDMTIALNDLENFIHSKNEILPIIKAGLIHSQFEIIHPFLDGNGRTGRMLTNFYLWQERFLEKPVLFLSSYFREHQNEYYDGLMAYSEGEISKWINFFLDGVIQIANEAIIITDKITVLRERDMLKVQALGKRAAEITITILPKLYGQPIVNTNIIQKWTGFTSRGGAKAVIDRFVQLGILVPKDRTEKSIQTYIYKDYVDIFMAK